MIYFNINLVLDHRLCMYVLEYDQLYNLNYMSLRLSKLDLVNSEIQLSYRKFKIQTKL